MGNIIPLHGDPHQMTQELLPWYRNGTLEPGEQLMVEEHLKACAGCRAELDSETKLASAYVDLAVDEDVPEAAARARALVAARARPRRTGWWPASPAARFALIAASQLLIIGTSIGIYSGATRSVAVDYHALSAPAAPAATGNVIVVFRPDVSEQVLRATLHAAGARIVDGPTAADAYVLAVAPNSVANALATLRARSDVVLAQPLGAELRR
ncbi:MAG: zf-HC2 domain-containing protein [Sphingobium sp.]|nr:zf-HC2 domain-containing protein [Sphingobium sp.]